MSEKKTIFLALADVAFSSSFVISLLGTVNRMISENKYNLVIVPGNSRHSLVSHYNTLGFDPKLGIDQKPFGGEKFDYWVNVSSSAIFNVDQFTKLIDALGEHPVVAGVCRMENLESCSFIENAGFTKMVELDAWKRENPNTKYKSVAYSEMKFFGVRSEVLHAMKYPHFECDAVLSPPSETGVVTRDLLSHEMAFCRNVKLAGYDIMINTDIVVGHEVRIIV